MDEIKVGMGEEEDEMIEIILLDVNYVVNTVTGLLTVEKDSTVNSKVSKDKVVKI